MRALHQAWFRRLAVVVRLAVDPARLRSPASWVVEPWAVGVGFEPWLDRLHFLVWAHNYDARGDGEVLSTEGWPRCPSASSTRCC